MAKRSRARTQQPTLTRLESEVMGVVWDFAPEPVCVRDVLSKLNESRAKPLAYNTVQTVFTLLKDKKAIRHSATLGRAHYFVPQVSRDQAARHILSDLSQRLFGGRVKPMIHQLIDDAELSTDEWRQLRSWVDEKLKDSPPSSSRQERDGGQTP